MTPIELRTAYNLTPSTNGDTIHALRQVYGHPLRLIAEACQTSERTLYARLDRLGLIKSSRPGRRPNHIADVGKMVVYFNNHEQRMKQSEGTF